MIHRFSARPLFRVFVAFAFAAQAMAKPPNILFAIADDWGLHAGAYGDAVVKTPVFDKLAKEGVLFEQAYVSSPSCAPSRAAILSGQWHWRLGPAANLWGPIPPETPLYTELLERSGYFVGYTRKGWGPGTDKVRGRNPAGREFKDFKRFLASRPKDKPFCFWFGSLDPHRDYVKDSGKKSGIPLDQIHCPPYFPDNPVSRGDIADYYYEVQRFDRETGELIEQLRELGELENTLIVVTSDHGMPFPRAKSNLYDSGTRVPLVIRLPGGKPGGHRVTDFVSLTDLAPTFLQSAGLPIPEPMTGRSLVPLLHAGKSGRIDASRNHILTGKERHVPSQPAPDSGGYPSRALRNDEFLLIRNFIPDRWPSGTGDWQTAFIPGAWYADCDNGPMKSDLIKNRAKNETTQWIYGLSFGMRPEFELYDLKADPDQINNVARNPEYKAVLDRLSKQLNDELSASGDPRVIGGGDMFDAFPYTGGAPKHPDHTEQRKGKRANP